MFIRFLLAVLWGILGHFRYLQKSGHSSSKIALNITFSIRNEGYIVCDNILDRRVFENVFDKVEKSGFEKSNFRKILSILSPTGILLLLKIR